MRFMIVRKADRDTEAGRAPSEELLAAMATYNEELLAAGVLRGGDGLKPTSRGARVKFTGGEPAVIDGPFAETKELIAGYTIIEVDSREEALEWAKRWPGLDGNGGVELEVRELFELSDFEPGEAVDRHARIGERLADG